MTTAVKAVDTAEVKKAYDGPKRVLQLEAHEGEKGVYYRGSLRIGDQSIRVFATPKNGNINVFLDENKQVNNSVVDLAEFANLKQIR